MKKIKYWIIVIIAFLFIGYIGFVEDTYTREVEVTSINGTIVRVVDDYNAWEFYTEKPNEYHIGEIITVKMKANRTTSPRDDQIIGVK